MTVEIILSVVNAFRDGDNIKVWFYLRYMNKSWCNLISYTYCKAQIIQKILETLN